MKLKQDNPLTKLKRNIRELQLDIKAIEEEHEHYCFKGSEEKVESWFKSLPIESLFDSLTKDYNKPRNKYSLKDLHHKSELRKLYDKKTHELELKEIELSIAKIDIVLKNINEVLSGTNPERNSKGKKTPRRKVGRAQA